MRTAYILIPLGSEKFVKGICDKESSGLVGTTHWAGQHCHHPTSCHIHCFWAWGICTILRKTFTWFLQESCMNLGKIIARFVAKMSNNNARSMQDSGKNFAKFLQKLSKNHAEFFQHCSEPCTNYPKYLQKLSTTLAKFFQ